MCSREVKGFVTDVPLAQTAILVLCCIQETKRLSADSLYLYVFLLVLYARNSQSSFRSRCVNLN